MNELTPEQSNQLSKWVTQRDSILLDIAKNRGENEKLIISNKNLAESNTEISNSIQQNIGRLEELKKKDLEFSTLTQSENIGLVSENTRLQSENSNLRKINDLLMEKKESLTTDIKGLSDIHDRVFSKVNGLESIVGGITKISSDNAVEINNILLTVRDELKKIIEINKINVDKTNAVIHDLPPMIFNLQRDIMERKAFNKRIQTNHDIPGK